MQPDFVSKNHRHSTAFWILKIIWSTNSLNRQDGCCWWCGQLCPYLESAWMGVWVWVTKIRWLTRDWIGSSVGKIKPYKCCILTASFFCLSFNIASFDNETFLEDKPLREQEIGLTLIDSWERLCILSLTTSILTHLTLINVGAMAGGQDPLAKY